MGNLVIGQLIDQLPNQLPNQLPDYSITRLSNSLF